MVTIWKSRKFWIMCTDTIVSLATYFVGKYLDPASVKDILFLIGALQPVILLVIASITVQNIQGIKADADIQSALIYQEPAEPIVEPVK
jgi:hypothetical protein